MSIITSLPEPYHGSHLPFLMNRLSHLHTEWVTLFRTRLLFFHLLLSYWCLLKLKPLLSSAWTSAPCFSLLYFPKLGWPHVVLFHLFYLREEMLSKLSLSASLDFWGLQFSSFCWLVVAFTSCLVPLGSSKSCRGSDVLEGLPCMVCDVTMHGLSNGVKVSRLCHLTRVVRYRTQKYVVPG